MSSSDASALSPDQIIEAFPGIAQALEDAARNSGISPTDMQSKMWDQAVHGR
jgi:hypothetical protein